jgi:hypothetical protein
MRSKCQEKRCASIPIPYSPFAYAPSPSQNCSFAFRTTYSAYPLGLEEPWVRPVHDGLPSHSLQPPPVVGLLWPQARVQGVVPSEPPRIKLSTSLVGFLRAF